MHLIRTNVRHKQTIFVEDLGFKTYISKAIRDTVMENEFQYTVLKAYNNSESVCISVLMLQVPTLEVIVMY